MFELNWPCSMRRDAKWPRPSLMIYSDSFAISRISSMKYIFDTQLFEKILMKYSEACEKIINSVSNTWIFVSHSLTYCRVMEHRLTRVNHRLRRQADILSQLCRCNFPSTKSSHCTECAKCPCAPVQKRQLHSVEVWNSHTCNPLGGISVELVYTSVGVASNP